MSTVVIVGRKNVGKSTIFNRLIGTKLSVVYKEPGITRDRIYGEAEWCGRVFDVIDTGGFFPNEKHALAQKINEQIKFGLQEADLIYFVVDGKRGLEPADHEVCQYLRKFDKTIFLVINKIDNKKDHIKALEFSNFGFHNVFNVSAEAGIGFGDLLDETIKILPKLGRVKIDEITKILILGRPNAGKSTLLNAMTKSERAIVDEEPGTTRDPVKTSFAFKGKNIEIIDTCGIRKPSRLKKAVEFYAMIRATKSIEYANVAVLIFDSTQGVVEQDRRIASLILSKAKGMVIAPNKIDLIAKRNRPKIISSTQKSFKFLEFVPIVPISAKLSTGIDLLLNRVLEIDSENRKLADKKVLSSISKKLHPPPGGHLLNLKQIGTKPPVFRATLNKSVRESYTKYIRNTIRHYFGYVGVPILIKTKIIRKSKKGWGD